MAAYYWPLGGMLGTQVAGALVLATIPVLAPEIAGEIGVDTSLIGVYTGVLFTAAALMLTFSGSLIARFGAVRTNQLAVGCSGVALLVALIPGAAALVACAILVGIGYGPNTPSGSQVLANSVPPRRRSLAFSLKQSGAPLGGVVAGVLLPFIVVTAGWRVALLSSAVIAILIAFAVEPLRRRLDVTQVAVAAGRVSPRRAMQVVFQNPSLKRLTIGAFMLMFVHGCYQTFFVAYLVDGIGLTLALAGALYAVLQAAGAVSRAGLGWLVDRLGSARRVLVSVAVIAALSSLWASAFDASWSLWSLALVSVLAGVGSSGWYGVFLAEIARLGVGDEVGLATGGSLFFVYWAIVVGPLLMSVVVTAAGGYAPAFWLVAALAAVASLLLARG